MIKYNDILFNYILAIICNDLLPLITPTLRYYFNKICFLYETQFDKLLKLVFIRESFPTIKAI